MGIKAGPKRIAIGAKETIRPGNTPTLKPQAHKGRLATEHFRKRRKRDPLVQVIDDIPGIAADAAQESGISAVHPRQP